MIEIIKNYLEVKLEYLQYLHELIQPTSPSKPAWMQANGLISKTTGGSDKGVMKLETEVGEGSGRRHLPSFVPLFAGNGGGRDLGRDDMPPTAADEMLLLQMAHSSFRGPVQFH